MRLSPCPYCHSPVEIIDLGGGHVCVGCAECGMGGPTARNFDVTLAVRAWEHLCRRICRNCRQVYIKRLVELRKKLDAKTAGT